MFSSIVPRFDPSFCFGFSDILPRFGPFFFRVLRHRVRASLIFLRIASGCFLIFTSIMSEHCLSFSVSRLDFSSSSSALCPSIAYLFQHCVRLFPIFLGIVSKHHLSFLVLRLTFSYLPWHSVRASLIFFGIMSEHRLSFSASLQISLSFLASCPSIAYIFWHRVRIYPIFTGIVFESLIFPSIVLGFLLVRQSGKLSSVSLWYWVRGQNCWSSGFFTRVHFTLPLLAVRTHDSLIHSL